MMQAKISIKLAVFGIQDHKILLLLDGDHLIQSNLTSDTSFDVTAKKKFTQTTNIRLKGDYIEQLYTIQDKKNEIVIVYYLLLSDTTSILPKKLQWKNVDKISKKAKDGPIIRYALQRLQWKVEYTNVIYSFLPKYFTLSTLQKAYEVILGKKFDKRNFRKKIISLDFLSPTGQISTKTARPAQMYSFKKRKPVLVKVFS